jgi:glycosyltransferase involved in cell wall biosynthesis
MSQRREVIFHVPSLEGGGAERVAVEIAKYFVSQGHKPVFFVHTQKAAYELPQNVELIVAKSSGHLARVLELRKLIKLRRPAAVISLLPYANIISCIAALGSRKHTRLIVSEHTVFSSAHASGVKAKLKWKIATCLYQVSHSIVAVSSGVANELRGTLKGRGAKKVSVIHNPSYISHAPAHLRKQTHRRTRLLAVGRLVEEKQFDHLIRAFARVRAIVSDATLTIAGEGPQRSYLESLIRDLKLSDCVRLHGFVRDIGALYAEADLFVCSSKLEGFGNVIVEALSYGLPVVSTRCPHGPEEILQNGRYGRLVPVDDERALADALVESLFSTVDQSQLLARSRDFSLEVIGRSYLNLVGLSAVSQNEAPAPGKPV